MENEKNTEENPELKKKYPYISYSDNDDVSNFENNLENIHDHFTVSGYDTAADFRNK